MPWVRLDENFSTNEKVLKAGKDARELYISALCHCNRNLTDGFVDGGIVRQLGALFEVYDTDAAIAKLVGLNLWEAVDSGYHVHDYLKYNPSRADVLRQRAGNARRQAEWQAQHRDRDGRFQGTIDVPDNTVTNAVSNIRPPSPSPSPSPGPIPGPRNECAASPPPAPEAAPVSTSEKPKRTRPERNPLAILYHEIARVWPNQVQEATIVRTVQDQPLFQRCIEAWRLAGYKPTNVAGVLDWYRRGGAPSGGARARDAPAIKPPTPEKDYLEGFDGFLVATPEAPHGEILRKVQR